MNHLHALRTRFAHWLWAILLNRHVFRREPDFIVGGRENPYLRRWHLIPRNPVFNIYLHHFLRSDDDRAHHCHPWLSLSLILAGSYTEHTIARGGVHHRRYYSAGDLRLRSARFAHRIEIQPGNPCWTLFITGPVVREWGFHCPHGWVPHADFVGTDPGDIGRGCDAPSRPPRPFWRAWNRKNA
jgi:hypothetical protein